MSCEGGQIAGVEVPVSEDCECVGISRIVWNNNNSFTITLTNGGSFTSPVLTGPQGDEATVEMRASGNILQYQVNNSGVWIDLFDLSELEPQSVLANQYPATATLGTAFETLNADAAGTARQPWVLPANTLGADGDEISIHAVFTTNSSSITTQVARVQFNGTTLVYEPAFGTGCVANYITIDVRLSRVSNTTIKYTTEVNFYGGLLPSFLDGRKSSVITAAGLDLAANPYDITAQGDSVVAGDITLQEFEIKLGSI